MAGLKVLAKKAKKLGVEKLMSVDDAKNLSDLKAGTIVVATAAELRHAEHRNVAADAKREHLRLMIPSRFHSDSDKFPCVMAYLGTKNVKSAKASRQVDCFEFRKNQASFENDKEMFEKALELSRLTISELNNVSNNKSFKDFEPGTIMNCSKLRYITIRKPAALEEVPVIAYR